MAAACRVECRPARRETAGNDPQCPPFSRCRRFRRPRLAGDQPAQHLPAAGADGVDPAAVLQRAEPQRGHRAAGTVPRHQRRVLHVRAGLHPPDPAALAQRRVDGAVPAGRGCSRHHAPDPRERRRRQRARHAAVPAGGRHGRHRSPAAGPARHGRDHAGAAVRDPDLVADRDRHGHGLPGGRPHRREPVRHHAARGPARQRGCGRARRWCSSATSTSPTSTS